MTEMGNGISVVRTREIDPCDRGQRFPRGVKVIRADAVENYLSEQIHSDRNNVNEGEIMTPLGTKGKAPVKLRE